MAQKNKVKELVGRGLNSYHTKALQQMDRIEKKNKEQNHKISILSNELDNDYLTKTEEGSVISLEHSKEGMVYLDELQGNTLVNYCTDGSKELTLNGDIDTEGTFVTTTEGVDNGKVDVMCEGNTLVNLVKTLGEKTFISRNFELLHSKVNTVYTVLLDIKLTSEVYVGFLNSNGSWSGSAKTLTTSGSYILNFTPIDEDVKFRINGASTQVTVDKLIVLEGNYTNISVPQVHFEGMKSVGQDDENGHKIEILSQNYQELNTDTNGLVCHLKAGTSAIINNIMSDLSGNGNNATLYGASINGNYLNFNGESDYATINRCVSDDFTISLKAEVISAKGGSLGNDSHWYNYAGLVDGEYPSVVNDFGLTITNEGYPCLGIGKPDTTVRHKETCFNKLTTFTYTRNKTTGEMKLYIDGKHSATISSTNKNSLNDNPLLFIGRSATKTTAYANMKFYELKIYNKVLNESEIFKFNKKEILINEPLRATENYKDKFVKINGKWFIERNCDVEVLDGTNPYWYAFQNNEQSIKAFVLNGFTQRKRSEPFVIENYPCINSSVWSARTGAGLYNGTGDQCGLAINESDLTSLDDAGVKEYLSRKPIRLVYAKDIPTYEPLQIEPTLNTYNDVTHISNNSIIPCNMKIKNSGYNAIIKPSTLYTVALDTNNNGTIGMNLGGAKVTTTNNVAKITTPATLTDDSLRLYGKGIKGSKVRLLEGDKTNWIPSFFEGMKSSFEDKVQEDGSYKMEILSSNENLFNVDALIANQRDNKNRIKLSKLDNGFRMTSLVSDAWLASNTMLKLKPNKRYKIKFKTKNDGVLGSIKFWTPNPFRVAFDYGIHNGNQEYEYNFTTNKEGEIHIQLNTTRDIAGQSTIDITDISITELNHVENKSNKIQFSSIEPLRGVGDVKDRFVFKEDGKLMIERNCGHYIFNENTPWIGTDYKNKGHWIRVNDNQIPNYKPNLKPTLSIPSVTDFSCWNNNDNELEVFWDWTGTHMYIFLHSAKTKWNVKTNYNGSAISDYMKNNPIEMVYELLEPTYEEIPYELQKIILEGYENGTLFFDTNIPPTSTITYAGETPIVKATKLNKTEVLNNTEDINDNIIPYLMDMDYRVVMLQLATEELEGGVSMARLFGGTYEMIKRDILSKRLTREEYGYRLADYFNAGKLTEEQVRELEELR